MCLYVFLGGTYPFDSAAGSLQELVLNGQFVLLYANNRLRRYRRDRICNFIMMIWSVRILGRFHFRHSRFSRVSEDAKDLIRQALVVDPSNRISLEKVLLFSVLLSC